MFSEFARRLLAWYEVSARRLPWRGIHDPYAIWVSEVMLQQTRVETVIPYFQRWMERFPTLIALAGAPEQEVLQLWEGLGYYTRARNLHKAAQIVVHEYGGELPSDRAALEHLPGIGRYTAAAIASIAFGLDEATLDGNIRRVLARVFHMDLPARSPDGERRLWQLARQHLPAGRAGDYNQALMDLGATICTPRAPACFICPLETLCLARRLGVQEQLPRLERRAPVPHYLVAAAVIQKDEQVLITQRPAQGLLGGMWEFPGGKVEAGESLQDGLRREICEELGIRIEVGELLGVFKHAYTHFRVTLHAFYCKVLEGEPTALQAADWRWASLQQLEDFPMGKIDRQISRKLADKNNEAFGKPIPD
ncbi:MAG: A/G-specific adenine glycosylase [Anaerolineales bacterium]